MRSSIRSAARADGGGNIARRREAHLPERSAALIAYDAQVRHPVVHFNVFGDRDGKGFRPIDRFKADRHAVEKVAPTGRTFGEEFYRELHDAP